MTHLANLTSTLLGATASELPPPSVLSYFDLRAARRALVRSIEDSSQPSSGESARPVGLNPLPASSRKPT